MAEEAKKKADAPAAPQAAGHGDKGADKGKDAAKGGAGGLLAKTPVLLGGVMILEAAVLFAGFKFLGSAPKAASGADITITEDGSHGDDQAKSDDGHGKTDAHGKGASTKTSSKKTVEVQVIDFRAPNRQTGRPFLYDVTIFAVTKGEHQEHVETTIKERGALIKDRLRTIIAQSDPEKLGGGSEPGLETLRRQVKYQLDDIIGEGMIDEVLVPRCIPIRADF
jgi:flagellar basal body-associated protein FliL